MTLKGTELFTINGNSSALSVGDFWSWAYSDLINNTERGVLGEFLVYSSLFCPNSSQSRVNWTPYDILSSTGRRIEVKTAAYLQSWESDYYSKILFNIAPRRTWHPDEGYSADSSRHSDLYVFCLFTATSREQSILNLDLWEFYLLPTAVLDREKGTQKSIGLQSLLQLSPLKVDYAGLGDAIETLDLQRK